MKSSPTADAKKRRRCRASISCSCGCVARSARTAEHRSLDDPPPGHRGLDLCGIREVAMVRLASHAVVVQPRNGLVFGCATRRERLDRPEGKPLESPARIGLDDVAFGHAGRIEMRARSDAGRAEEPARFVAGPRARLPAAECVARALPPGRNAGVEARCLLWQCGDEVVAERGRVIFDCVDDLARRRAAAGRISRPKSGTYPTAARTLVSSVTLFRSNVSRA